MPRHNIRPEVVPQIVAVLKESKQCKGVLSEGPGCYCFEGAVCEAYRRAHPGEAEWDRGYFVTEDERNDVAPTCAVNLWATGWYCSIRFRDVRGRDFSAHLFNDRGCDFPWFIAALEAE